MKIAEKLKNRKEKRMEIIMTIISVEFIIHLPILIHCIEKNINYWKALFIWNLVGLGALILIFLTMLVWIYTYDSPEY